MTYISLTVLSLAVATVFNTLSIRQMTRAMKQDQSANQNKTVAALIRRDEVTKFRCENVAHCFSDRYNRNVT